MKKMDKKEYFENQGSWKSEQILVSFALYKKQQFVHLYLCLRYTFKDKLLQIAFLKG